MKYIKKYNNFKINENLDMDSILDKINKIGIDKLTFFEKEYLRKHGKDSDSDSDEDSNKKLNMEIHNYNKDTNDLANSFGIDIDIENDNDIKYPNFVHIDGEYEVVDYTVGTEEDIDKLEKKVELMSDSDKIILDLYWKKTIKEGDKKYSKLTNNIRETNSFQTIGFYFITDNHDIILSFVDFEQDEAPEIDFRYQSEYRFKTIEEFNKLKDIISNMSKDTDDYLKNYIITYMEKKIEDNPDWFIS